jgi:hypothetical protein
MTRRKLSVRWNLAKSKTSRLKRSSFIFRKSSYDTSQARAKSTTGPRRTKVVNKQPMLRADCHIAQLHFSLWTVSRTIARSRCKHSKRLIEGRCRCDQAGPQDNPDRKGINTDGGWPFSQGSPVQQSERLDREARCADTQCLSR